MAEIIVYHWCGWLALMAGYFMVPLFPVFRRRRALMPVVWLLLTVRHAVAVINTFVATVPLAGQDARGFYLWAAHMWDETSGYFGVGSSFYGHLLGTVFHVTGPSHLLAHQLSILAFLFSCAVLVRILERLNKERHAAAVLWVYGLWPSFLILSSIPMREVYETLFLMCAVLMGFNYHGSHPRRSRYLIGVLASALAMGMFHRGLIVYVVVLFPMVAFWPLNAASRRRRFAIPVKHKIMGVVLLLAVWASLYVLSTRYRVAGLSIPRMIASGDLVETVVETREEAAKKEARTHYGAELDVSGPMRLVKSGGAMLGYYLFAPLPHQVRRLMDLPPFGESVMRMALLAVILASMLKADGGARSPRILLLAVYFSIALMWAVGTHNYGTALRHNQMHNWILFVLGVPVIMEWMERRAQKGRPSVPGETSA